jgi:hypothetical protein
METAQAPDLEKQFQKDAKNIIISEEDDEIGDIMDVGEEYEDIEIGNAEKPKSQ